MDSRTLRLIARRARGLALVQMNQIDDSGSQPLRKGHPEYALNCSAADPADWQCSCPEAIKVAQQEAMLQAKNAELAAEVLSGARPLVVAALSRFIAAQELDFPGLGCKHRDAVAHLRGKLDLKAWLAGLAKEITPGVPAFLGGAPAKDEQGQPIWTSPYGYASAIYRAEVLANAEPAPAPEPVHRPLPILAILVRARRGYVIDLGDRKPHWMVWHRLPLDPATGEPIEKPAALALARRYPPYANPEAVEILIASCPPEIAATARVLPC